MSEYAYQYYQQAERKHARYESERPCCAYCGEPILDDYAYRIDGDLVCKECLEDLKEYVE